MKVIYIKAHPFSVELLEINDTLEVYQHLVSGRIEVVYAAGLQRYHSLMVVNEEGVLLDLPVNPLASMLYGDYIAGDAVVVGRIGPDFTDIPDELAEILLEFGGRKNG